MDEQFEAAEAWYNETVRRIQRGTYVSSREAETTTLAQILQRYERDKLRDRKPSNRSKVENRLNQIRGDAIATRMVASLTTPDIANYRDYLLQKGWIANIDSAVSRIRKKGGESSRISELKNLPYLRAQADSATDINEQRRIQKIILEVETREKINYPARTTLTNKIQLIYSALKHARGIMPGIPNLEPVDMPKANPGRDRRLEAKDDEERRLLEAASYEDPLISLIIRFAIATALRRERILTFDTRCFRDIGAGRRAIVFPLDRRVATQRTGVIPVTKEIQLIIDDAINISNERLGAAKNGIDNHTLIFPINENTFEKAFRRVLTRAEIDDFRFHDLRHEATSRLFEGGLTVVEVQSVTGHSTKEMIDRYSHYSSSIVHNKLERGLDAGLLFDEIMFLAKQYNAIGGCRTKLLSALQA